MTANRLLKGEWGMRHTAVMLLIVELISDRGLSDSYNRALLAESPHQKHHHFHDVFLSFSSIFVFER